MRRGEIAINVVIIIALGLIVLTILGSLLVSRMITVNEATSNCEQIYKGTCMSRAGCAFRGGTIAPGDSCQGGITTQMSDTWVVESYPEGGSVCCKLGIAN